jgi:hypothetical protein
MFSFQSLTKSADIYFVCFQCGLSYFYMRKINESRCCARIIEATATHTQTHTKLLTSFRVSYLNMFISVFWSALYRKL